MIASAEDPSLDNFHLGNVARELLKTFARALSLDYFRFRPFAWELSFGLFGIRGSVSLAWDLWHGIFGLGSLAWVLWLWIFGLGSLVWDVWLGIFGFGSLAWALWYWILGLASLALILALDLWLDIFGLELGLKSWA